MNYTLTITEEQARVLSKAADLYSRVCMGQLEAVADVWPESFPLRDKLKALKPLVGTGPNGHHSFNPNLPHYGELTTAHDLHQVIRHRLAWDRNPKGGIQVDYNPPMKYSKEPLATIKPTT